MRTDKHQTVKQSSETARVYLQLCLILFFLMPAGCKQKKAKVLPPNELTIEHFICTNSITVGDSVELTVTAYVPTNATVSFPPLNDEKNVVVLDQNRREISRNDGLKKIEMFYKLTSFRLGDHRLSTNAIICTFDNGKMVKKDFPDIVLRVRSALNGKQVASTKIADIKPIKRPPPRFPRWLWVFSLVALISFLIGSIVSKIWANRPVEKRQPPPLPPHVIALQALDALKNKHWLEQDQCDLFYTELSMILREYLKGRFGLNAPDKTTEEIARDMYESKVLPVRQQNILKEFLRQADRVKFAKDHPGKTTMQHAFDTTREFVEETKYEPENQLNQKDQD